MVEAHSFASSRMSSAVILSCLASFLASPRRPTKTWMPVVKRLMTGLGWHPTVQPTDELTTGQPRRRRMSSSDTVLPSTQKISKYAAAHVHASPRPAENRGDNPVNQSVTQITHSPTHHDWCPHESRRDGGPSGPGLTGNQRSSSSSGAAGWW
ncbi:uncharacterized protein IWZ02DRAFT_240087 [Phyllosticta citriasiana]|uniref:uncharacterized protein n=1 Tax=Phyllosticta citriasiana TaxID=595635 RepID=UPI0030FD876B